MVFGILKIAGLIFIVLIGIIFIGGFMIYNFASFEIASVCLSDKTTISNVSCSLEDSCSGKFFTSDSNSSGNTPVQIKEKFDEILNEASFCNDDNICEYRNISIVKDRGLIKNEFGGDIGLVDSCEGISLSVRLKLKEIVEIAKSMKDK